MQMWVRCGVMRCNAVALLGGGCLQQQRMRMLHRHLLLNEHLLLGKGGRAVYLGPSQQALPYFEHHRFLCPDKVNPPDFMMDVIGGDGGDARFHEMTATG